MSSAFQVLQSSFTHAKGRDSSSRDVEAGLDIQMPVLPASHVSFSPTRVTSDTQRLTTPCPERSS